MALNTVKGLNGPFREICPLSEVSRVGSSLFLLFL